MSFSHFRETLQLLPHYLQLKKQRWSSRASRREMEKALYTIPMPYTASGLYRYCWSCGQMGMEAENIAHAADCLWLRAQQRRRDN
jgi:hypothetical protein